MRFPRMSLLATAPYRLKYVHVRISAVARSRGVFLRRDTKQPVPIKSSITPCFPATHMLAVQRRGESDAFECIPYLSRRHAATAACRHYRARSRAISVRAGPLVLRSPPLSCSTLLAATTRYSRRSPSLATPSKCSFVTSFSRYPSRPCEKRYV